MAATPQPTPQPTLNLDSLIGLGQAYKSAADQFGATVGLKLNPLDGTYVRDPNFQTPAEQQALKMAQLQYALASNPELAASFANRGQNATQLSPEQLQNFRNGSGQTSAPGTTFGGAASQGLNVMSSEQAQQAQGLVAQLALLKQAKDKATVLNANGGQPGAGIAGILAHLGIQTPQSQAYSDYQSTVNQLSPQFQGAALTPGQAPGSGIDTAIANIVSQLGGLHRTAYAGAPQAPAGTPNLNLGSISLPGISSAYNATAPVPNSPGAMGQNAYQNQFGS